MRMTYSAMITAKEKNMRPTYHWVLAVEKGRKPIFLSPV